MFDKQFIDSTHTQMPFSTKKLLINEFEKLCRPYRHQTNTILNILTKIKDKAKGKAKILYKILSDKLQHPLSLRLCRQGDNFVPFGMKGRKKVSDYLTDRKFSLLRKERQWVLCCGDDIIWLVGERVDNRFRIDEKTRKVLVVSTIDQ